MKRDPKPRTLSHTLDTGRTLNLTVEELPALTRVVASWTPAGPLTEAEALAFGKWMHPVLWQYEGDGVPVEMQMMNVGVTCTSTDDGWGAVSYEAESRPSA